MLVHILGVFEELTAAASYENRTHLIKLSSHSKISATTGIEIVPILAYFWA